VFKRCKDACLELHENIVAVRQRRLVVDEQIAALIGGRGRGVRIINNVTEHRIEALSDQVYEPRVLWVFAPLSPTKVSAGLRDRWGGWTGAQFSTKIEDLRRVVCNLLLEYASRKTCAWLRQPLIKTCGQVSRLGFDDFRFGQSQDQS